MHGKVGSMRESVRERETERAGYSVILDISLAIQHQATAELSDMLKNHMRYRGSDRNLEDE